MLKRWFFLLAVLCMLIPMGAAAQDAMSLYQVEIAETNLQLLLPDRWNAMYSVQEPPVYTYILYDETYEDLSRYVMLATIPKEGDVPEEIAGFRDEAESLFTQGVGIGTTLASQHILDRMDALLTYDIDEAFDLLFLDDDSRYIFLMYPRPSSMNDAVYTQDVETIQQSIALLENTHPAHYDETAFTTEAAEGGVSITGYAGTSVRVDIPPTIGGEPVVSLAEKAFYEASVQHVHIPDSVKSIGSYAFSGCNFLRTVRLPEGMQSLQDGLFESCTLLQRITLPDSVETIGESVFWGCLRLKTVNLPTSLKEIAVTDLGFLSVPSISVITLDASNQAYQVVDGVLYTGDMQTLVRFPARLSDVTQYEVPEGTISVAPFAFAYASRLTNIVLPTSLETIGQHAFLATQALEYLAIPPGVTALDGALNEGAAVTVYGAAGSAAEQEAERVGIAFTPIAYPAP